MISLSEFEQIKNEVQNAITTSLSSLKMISPENYLLFLAGAEYVEELDKPGNKLNPFTIEYRRDSIRDRTRQKFLVEILKALYSFPNHEKVTSDSHQSINLELMVYSHIWESRHFLKQLYRLAHLLDKSPYAWKLEVPPYGKHDFVRTKIRDIFKKLGNPMDQVITNGFHSQLRNAFAHSDYWIMEEGIKRIILENFEGKAWEMKDIGFNDWTKRFVYSILSSYYLLKIVHEKRKSLPDDFGTDVFTIQLPRKKNPNWSDPCQVRYDVSTDSFHFK